ncbi:hypothetical protein [Photobacterium leiognathi]|uniref:hypothetical protein n=1 Tax=Photobacterium leiognathi TaxID=553611 RepID=UPI002981880C|nr:hypothetical protein [Photobacterium leiognathi]
MKKILFIVTTLLFFGLYLGYEPALEICKKENILSLCVLTTMIIKLPSWIGSFCGIFLSASLAFYFSQRKQKKDDFNKKCLYELEIANNTIILLTKCLGDLGTIKNSYFDIIHDNNKITRGLNYKYMIGRDYYYAVFNPVDLNYLADLNDVEPKSIRNPSYVYNVFDNYNVAIEIAKKRSDLAININDIILNIQFDKSHNPHLFPSFNEIKDHVKFGDLINFLVITEHQIDMIDKSIFELKDLLERLPKVMNQYFLSLKNDDPLFNQKIKYLFTYDYAHDSVKNNNYNSNLFTPINKLDVNRELNYLIYNNPYFYKNWEPEGWISYQ